MTSIPSTNSSFQVEGFPNKCPFCHNKISPIGLFAYKNHYKEELEVFMRCPNIDCLRSFISYYELGYKSSSFTGRTTSGNLLGKTFAESIKLVSPSFIKIYNEAFVADQQKLWEICGVGYRKALEFLVKDYAISKNPDERALIEKRNLMACITDYIDDRRIKSVAKRAAWMGNDETHYIRKWEGLDLSHLKTLINLTVHWIEMEALTNQFETKMPH